MKDMMTGAVTWRNKRDLILEMQLIFLEYGERRGDHIERQTKRRR